MLMNVARRGNRARQKLRPQDPTDLSFSLNTDYLPESFVKDDVVLDGGRHIIFASELMLEFLRKAKTWYIDATFKVVRDPFYQLFTVHAFIRNASCLKQV